jgi:hypothetical protein
MLDSNQSGPSFSQHTLALAQLQIYTTNDPNQTTTDPATFAANNHLVYNLNIGTTFDTPPNDQTGNTILTNAVGSGIADLYAYIPVSDFIYKTDQYVILYFFAGNSPYPTSGGFEEWVAFTKVPDRSSTLFLGSIAFGALLFLRWFMARPLKKALRSPR